MINNKNWRDINPDLPAIDALKQCFDEQIMTSMNKFTLRVMTYALDGVRYSGYQKVSWDEIVKRKPIVQWFDGLQVTWTDVYIETELTRRSRPVSELSVEDRMMMYDYHASARRYSGSYNEVESICSAEGMQFTKKRNDLLKSRIPNEIY